MRNSIHEAISEAVSELCNCSFPVQLLRPGKFRCWDSPTQVTYLASVVGTSTYNSSHILNHMDSWVRSKEAVVDVGSITLEVLNGECGVGMSCMTSRKRETGECAEEGSGTTLDRDLKHLQKCICG